MLRICATLLCAALFAVADEATVRAEDNLEKRSQLALEEADAQIDAARKAYNDGDIAKFREHTGAAANMAELCYESLQETGKRARRSPKWFKRAEQKLVFLLRRISSLSNDVEAEDRPTVESLRTRVRDVHDEILQDIMSQK